MGSNFPNNPPDSRTSLVQNQRLSNSESLQKASFVIDVPNAENKSKSNSPIFQDNVISLPPFQSCPAVVPAKLLRNHITMIFVSHLKKRLLAVHCLFQKLLFAVELTNRRKAFLKCSN